MGDGADGASLKNKEKAEFIHTLHRFNGMAQTIRRQGFFFISDTDRIQISVSGIYQGFYKQRGWRTEKEKSAHRIQCTQQGVRQ